MSLVNFNYMQKGKCLKCGKSDYSHCISFDDGQECCKECCETMQKEQFKYTRIETPERWTRTEKKQYFARYCRRTKHGEIIIPIPIFILNIIKKLCKKN